MVTLLKKELCTDGQRRSSRFELVMFVGSSTLIGHNNLSRGEWAKVSGSAASMDNMMKAK